MVQCAGTSEMTPRIVSVIPTALLNESATWFSNCDKVSFKSIKGNPIGTEESSV